MRSSDLLALIDNLRQAGQRGLRLLLDGASLRRGTVPEWLEASTDFLITGLTPGSTMLQVEAPAFSETIAPDMRQPDMWREMPGPDDSVFTVMGMCLRDTETENADSDRFDRGVLEGFSRFGRFLGRIDSLEICRQDGKESPFNLTSESMNHVEKLLSKTPEPQTLVVSGKLEQITHKTGQFLLELPGGAQLRGRAHPEFLSAEEMRELWGKKVSVKGPVHFKPSGAARFLEAEILKIMEPAEEVFERLPIAVQLEAPFAGVVQAARIPVEISEIWGQWPGEESIEELLAEL